MNDSKPKMLIVGDWHSPTLELARGILTAAKRRDVVLVPSVFAAAPPPRIDLDLLTWPAPTEWVPPWERENPGDGATRRVRERSAMLKQLNPARWGRR